MAPGNDPRESERQALAAVLSSELFDRSKSLSRVLTYICQRHFEGQSSEIKEYSIAVEALGRPADFDQKKDAIVRVEMHRLRKRLREYYSGPGAENPVQIVLAEKGYVPEFVVRAAPPLLQPVTEQDLTEIATLPAVIEPPNPEFERVARWDSKNWILAGAGLALVTLAVGLYFFFGRPSSMAPPLATTTGPDASSSGGATAVAEDSGGVRILAGRPPGAFTDRDGNVWEGDRYFKGGQAAACRTDIITRGFDRNLFANMREGRFEYAIPLKPGVYEMELFFAETLFGDGNPLGGGETSRQFDVHANGLRLTTGLDILADAGMPNSVDSRVFKDLGPGPDGILHVKFEPLPGHKAFVNAIRIVPGQRGRLNPIRIVARPQAYRDPAGRWWLPDRYYLGGHQIVRPTVPFGSDEAYVYQSERYGNFNYSIPVAPGQYSATLYFYEYWWGNGHAGGPGGRRFDVYCNFKPLLTNFDVVSDRGPDQSAKRTFRNLAPNAQGKLVFAFVSHVNYALLNAIEILDESK